jgi:DNA primase
MAGLIPQDFIDDLVARADIVEVIGRRVQLKKAGREYKACCPFHDEKSPSFTVSPQKGFYHCFGCGAHGTAVSFLMDFDHMSFIEAIESLANSMGVEVPRSESDKPAQRYDELFSLLAKVEHHWQQCLRDDPSAIDYLKQRGIDGATAQRFGIGFAPEGWSLLLDRFGKSDAEIDRLLAAGLVIRKDNGRHYDRFRNRIVFPIRDARGRCIGFGGRTTGDEEPKYLNSPETVLFHKGSELYGLFEARQALRQIERLVVVEGYMDVVALARNGIDFAVATLGTATTAEHLNRLFRLCDNVAFCFDGDAAGRKAAWRALETALPHIREGRQIRFAFLPDGHDPDSYVNANGADALVATLDNGSALAEFLVMELSGQVDLASVEGKARFAELAKPLLGKIPQGVYRDLLLKLLADTVGLASDKLERSLASSQGYLRPSNRPAVAQARRARPLARNKPSVVRRAIALLLNHPTAALELDITQLAGVDKPGIDLLQRLIETLHQEPNMTTAGLLERWRHDAAGKHLGKLAAAELPDDEEFDAAAELQECLTALAAVARRQHFDILIEKQRVNNLNEDEKAELRRLGRA